MEETGVEAEMVSVLSFRHTHQSQWGRDDLYFVCRMKPVMNEDGSLPTPVPQEGEISEARWITFEECKESVGEGSDTPHPVMERVLRVVELGDGEGGGDIQR